MKILLPLLTALLAAVISNASAQTVYKCGNVYSQSPCPGSVAIDTDDSRTPAQKAQSDAATVQAAKSAEALEKERVTREKIQAAKPGKKPLAGSHTAKGGSAGKTGEAAAKKRKNEPEYFTAAAEPVPKKEKKAVKSQGDKLQVAKTDKPAKP